MSQPSCFCLCVKQNPKRKHCTALHIASGYGRTKIVVLLLANGASPRVGHKGHVSPHLPSPTTTTCALALTYLTPSTYVAQLSFKPLHTAAHRGHKLCLAHLLLADPAMLQLKTRGCSAADYARQYDEPEVVAALEKWAAGDKAGALRELGAADLISSLPPSSSSSAAAAVTDKASSSQMVQVQVSLWSWLLL